MTVLCEPLSDRERQIVKLGARGLTDKEIAERLAVSITTVRTYWVRLRRKLNASNRAQAIALALHEKEDQLHEAIAQLGQQPWLGIAVLDRYGHVLEANRTYRDMLGDASLPALSRNPGAFLRPRWVELPGSALRVLVAVVPMQSAEDRYAAYLIPSQFAIL